MAERTRTLSALALILAGGRSSRMGTDKRFLRYGSDTFLERACETAGEAFGKQNVLVSGKIEGLFTIPDLIPGYGPIGGFYSVLRHLDEMKQMPEWVCVIPVDMPRISCAILSILKNESKKAADSTKAICYEGFELPAIFRAGDGLLKVMDSLLKTEKSSMRSIMSLQQMLGVKKISLPRNTDSLFSNVNTPDDYEVVCHVSQV